MSQPEDVSTIRETFAPFRVVDLAAFVAHRCEKPIVLATCTCSAI